MAPSIWQILIIILVFMLLFGAGKFPRMMEDAAKGIKAFKKGLKEEDGDRKQISESKEADTVKKDTE